MGWSKLGASKIAHLREYYYNGGDMLELAKYQKKVLPKAAGSEEVILSASDILQSERTNRSRVLNEYGKYAERLHVSVPDQTSKRLMFYLNGKI